MVLAHVVVGWGCANDAKNAGAPARTLGPVPLPGGRPRIF